MLIGLNWMAFLDFWSHCFGSYGLSAVL